MISKKNLQRSKTKQMKMLVKIKNIQKSDIHFTRAKKQRYRLIVLKIFTDLGDSFPIFPSKLSQFLPYNEKHKTNLEC